MTIPFLCRIRLSRAAGFLVAFLAAVPAMADIELRVEGRPIDQPIQAFMTVTDGNGDAIGNLTAGDFAVTIDGSPIVIQGPDLTLPPSQDPNQKVSVAFVMDYSTSVTDIALSAMQLAVIDFVNAMNDGDRAAIVKFNSDAGASVVLPFTTIDHGAGNQALEDAVLAAYPGDGTNLLDAVNLAVNHFIAPPSPLPPGPKAVILISDGGDNESLLSESEVIALANANSIPVFSIGVGDLTVPGREELLTSLGSETGGDFFPAPTDADIADAYASISTRLNNEYLLSIPSGIADCADHTLGVTVAGQMTSVVFTRRVCDTIPDAFSFTAQTGVIPDREVTSNTVTVTGLEVPAHVSIISGRYSIGCTDTFVNTAGMISNGQTICVRQHTSTTFSTTKTSTLTIGGFSAAFTTTTGADTPPKKGGGGATGGVELLLGLVALAARRRRQA